MPDALTRELAAVIRRLLVLAESDFELRAELRALAEAILKATDDTRPEPAARYATQQPLPELTLGRSHAGPPSITVPVARSETPDDELAGIETRCRAKAENARTFAERLGGFGSGLDFDDGSTVEGQASEQNAGLHVVAAGSFEAVADALALVRDMIESGGGRGETFERALHLLVEAQSALRRALQPFKRPDDPDQRAVFDWARDLASRHQIFIRRHMRADDLADPAGWADLLARIHALTTAEESSRRRTRPSKTQADRLHDPLSRIREGRALSGDWPSVVQAVDEMVRDGVPPSNRDLRERLLPVIEDLPDLGDLPAGFGHVLREIDRYLAIRPAPAEPAAVDEPSAEVKAAARLLGGKSVVLIGGTRRREAQLALKRAFGLDELIWVETKEHQSLLTFEPVVARPDVAVVLLAIRWSSHAFGEVKGFCDRHGKPLVRLPGGYNPNQVAAQVVAQCSGQLGG